MVRLISVFGQKWNLEKLPTFYKHYKSLEINDFIIVLNNYDGIPLDKDDIKYFHWNEEFSERKRIDIEYELVSKHYDPEDFVVYADPDEIQYPSKTYNEYANDCEWLGGILYDVPTIGFIKKFGDNIITPDFSSRCGAWNKKICACKAIYKMDVGHHMLSGQEYNDSIPIQVTINHYKWDEYILDKIEVEERFNDPQLKYWKEELQRAKRLIKLEGENYEEA